MLELVRYMEAASGRTIPFEIAGRRPGADMLVHASSRTKCWNPCCAGDIAAAYADPSLAAKELNWKAELDLERACEDAWRWQVTHPNGYGQLHKTGAISLNIRLVVTFLVAGSGAPPGSRRV